MTTLFKLICFEYKACSVEYFMDCMQLYEIPLIIDSLNLTVKNDWLQTRQIFYAIAQTSSDKQLRPEKIMPLPYDEEFHKAEKLTKKQSEALKKLMEWENKNNKGVN